MVYKYTSCKTVIAKVIADLDIQEENIRVADMVEWIGEGLLKIGGFPQFIVKTTGREDLPLLTIDNYQAELPSDFYQLLQVSCSDSSTGIFYPMRQATGSFEYNPVSPEAINSGVDYDIATSSLVNLAMDLYGYTEYTDALAYINANPSIRALLTSLLSSTSTTSQTSISTSDFIYTVRGGYIKTNLETGYLMMSYQAIATDVDGYPLVPDNESYLEALYWYIVMKLMYPKWVMGSVRDLVYFEARRSWNFYRKQAYGAAMMPDKGQMESIKNAWVRLMPNINAMDTDLSHIGEQEVFYTHNN